MVGRNAYVLSTNKFNFRFYLVFEMMRGGALIDHIERRKKFTEREASVVLHCITSALAHLHSEGKFGISTIFNLIYRTGKSIEQGSHCLEKPGTGKKLKKNWNEHHNIFNNNKNQLYTICN